MATVTGFTAERMLEIEAASVVDGEVVGDNLILTKQDGSTIDAGSVRGAQGDPGTDAISSSVTVQADTNVQRTSDGRAKAAKPTENDDLTTKLYVDTLRYSIELGSSGVDLDTLKFPATYTQSLNANTSPLLHYPSTKAGYLEITANIGTDLNSLVWQTYTDYGTYGDRFYKRGFYNGSWSPWRTFAADDSTGWLDALAVGFKASAGCTLTSGNVMKSNGVVYLYLAGDMKTTRADGNITNLDMWQAPSGWVPSVTNGSITTAMTGMGFFATVSASGVITMTATSGSFAVNDGISASGSYRL